MRLKLTFENEKYDKKFGNYEEKAYLCGDNFKT